MERKQYIKLGWEMVQKDVSKVELALEKVGEVGGLGIARNGSVSYGIICKRLTQETVDRLQFERRRN